jgi:hypothetical protein
MKNLAPIVLLTVAAVILAAANWNPPTPAPSGGPDMVRAFRAHRDSRRIARDDAHRLAALAKAIRGQLDTDWRSNQPFIRTGVEADNLRLIARSVLMGGESLSPSYPDLPGAIAQHFTDYVGQSGGPLDEARKKKWLEAWESLGAACERAAKEL